ncbi:hypothetical protein BpHYR1_004438 [Brachionus plicatilis]|uniref:Uncharacterized protein n=1 Tax=Brachionus plicatilis TaxID=10195 RepID=A0A3M7RP71_BRAPC|nr:hypothetical protein BpHYR1_004438 [Brachionus plicatilis]
MYVKSRVVLKPQNRVQIRIGGAYSRVDRISDLYTLSFSLTPRDHFYSYRLIFPLELFLSRALARYYLYLIKTFIFDVTSVFANDVTLNLRATLRLWRMGTIHLFINCEKKMQHFYKEQNLFLA